MILPLNKLIALKNNRYIFSRGAMKAIDKIANLPEYPKDTESWKIVPNVLKMVLDDRIFIYVRESLEDAPAEAVEEEGAEEK